MRKNPLVNNQYYHIFNRSIAGYVIFNQADDYIRFIEMLSFYRFDNLPCNYSRFASYNRLRRKEMLDDLTKSEKPLVEIVAYSLMPTHFHLVLKQIENDGIAKYLMRLLDSYSRHFNLAHGRKGPLWEGHFKSVLIDTDEQMLHLTRYIHLNAVTASLVELPEDWPYSSYLEYLGKSTKTLCQFDQIIDIEPSKYKKFVLDQISYQRDLALIKHLLIDSYSG